MIKLWIYNFTSDLVTKEIIHNLIHYIIYNIFAPLNNNFTQHNIAPLWEA